MAAQKFDLFVSHNSLDKEFVDTLARRLSDEFDVHLWLDKWSLAAAADWAPAIDKALQTCAACAVFLGENGWGPHHLGEAQLALKRKREFPDFRVIPVLLPGASAENIDVTGDFFRQVHRVEFNRGINDEEALQRLWAATRGEAPGPPLMTAYKIERDAKYWQRLPLKDKRSALYAGEKLRDAEEIAARGEEGLTSLALDFLRAGAQDEQERFREAQSRTRKIITGLTVGLIFVAALAALAFIQRNRAVEAARREQEARVEADRAAGREKEAREDAEAARDAAEDSAEKERAARQGEEEQRKKAQESARLERVANQKTQEALRQEIIAKRQAEQRRKEAERQTRLARTNLSTSDFLVGESNLRQDDVKDGLFWNWRAYTDAPEDDPRRQRARAVIASWAAFSGRPAWHDDSVDEVAFSPDGRLFVTVSRDGKAAAWDAERLTPVGKPMRHDAPIAALAISPDGAAVLTGGHDGMARLWSAATSEQLGRPAEHRRLVQSVAFHPTRPLCAAGDEGGTVRLYGTAGSLIAVHSLAHGESVDAVAFSPDGRTLLTAGSDVIKLWDVETGLPRPQMMAHAGVRLAKFNRDGRTILSGSKYNAGSARLWDATTGEPRGEVMSHEGPITDIAFSPDDTRVVTASLDNTARLWDAGTGLPVGEPLKHGLPVSAAAFTRDGNVVVTGSYDKTVRMWDAPSGLPLGAPLRHERGVTSIALSPDGHRILSGSEDKTARLWDVSLNMPAQVFSSASDRVDAVAVSHDGRTLAAGGGAGTVQLWDIASAKPLGVPLPHETLIKAIAFSADDAVLLVATDNALQRWDVKSRLPLGAPAPHEVTVTVAAFNDDGTLLATGTGRLENGDSRVRLWDTTSGQPAGPPLIHPERVMALSLSPDGSLVASGAADQLVRVWDTRTGTHRFTPLVQGEWPKSLKWSPDGKTLFIGVGSVVRLWDVRRGQPAREFITDGFLDADDWVSITGVSRKGDSIVLARGNSARIWDVSTGQPRGELMRHPDAIHTAVLNAEGNKVFTAGGDGIVRSWSIRGPVPDHPESVRVLLEWLTGYEFATSAEPQFLKVNALSERRHQLLKLEERGLRH